MLPNKGVQKRKLDADGKPVRYKARLVICGNLDSDDPDKTFAQVVEFSIVRVTLAMAVEKE